MTDKTRAVSGGWVGSSAVNETGQRWMSAARRELRLNPAGWMSEMTGKSKGTHVITIGKGRWGSSAFGYDVAGYSSGVPNMQNIGSTSNGTISGQSFVFCGSTSLDVEAGRPSDIILGIRGDSNLRPTLTLPGIVENGSPTRAEYNGDDNVTYLGYRTNQGNMYNWMDARVGQQLNLLIT